MADKKIKFTFVMAEELKASLEAYASDQQQSISSVLNKWVVDNLVKEGYWESKKMTKTGSDRKN